MFICPVCSRQYLVGEGWIPPPCIFKSSDTIREIDQEKKCIFTHIECQCGQHIGVKVISGPKRAIGYWRIQFDCEEQKDNCNQFILPPIGFTHTELKYIYQKQLTNYVHKTLDVHMENKARVFMIQKMVRKFMKKSRTNSL